MKRNYEKIRRKKNVAIFSGRKICSCTVVRTKEELEDELQILREEFGC